MEVLCYAYKTNGAIDIDMWGLKLFQIYDRALFKDTF